MDIEGSLLKAPERTSARVISSVFFGSASASRNVPSPIVAAICRADSIVMSEPRLTASVVAPRASALGFAVAEHRTGVVNVEDIVNCAVTCNVPCRAMRAGGAASVDDANWGATSKAKAAAIDSLFMTSPE